MSNARLFLAGGADPNYIGASYLTGATSPVHLLLVALVSLVVPAIWGSLLIGLAGAGLYVLGTNELTDRAGLDGWRKALVLLIGIASGNLLFQYVNGLETSTAMAASAWMLLWCDDRRKLPVLVGIAPFLRPELGLLGVLLMLRLSIRSGTRETLIMSAIAAAVALPWLVWVYAQTGTILPSTMAAKLAWFHPPQISIIAKAIVTTYWLIVSYQLPLFLGLAGLFKVRGGRVAGLFVLLGITTAVLVMPNIVDWNYGRYTAIYMPILVAGIAAIAAERKRSSDFVIGLLSLFAAVTATLCIGIYPREIEYARRVQDHARFVATLPASSIVLIHDAGQVAWVQPKSRLIDLVGLKTPAVVPVHKSLTHGDCRRKDSLNAIGKAYSATHLVVINRWSWPCVADDMRATGWQLKPIYEDLYTVYELRPPRSAGKAEPQSAAGT